MLSNLYHKHQVTRVWLDMICIHQQDIAERNHQVRQMGEFYKKAGRVITWLGQADEDSDLAMEDLASFSEAPSRPKLRHRMKLLV
jgi:hypothetical protein